MLLKVLNDLCEVTTVLAELVRDLLHELEHQRNIDNMEFVIEETDQDGNKTLEKEPALDRYRRRAEEAERLLDKIEYNSRRI